MKNLEKRIIKSKKLKIEDRVEEHRLIAQDLANNFTCDMSYLEDEIQDTIDEMTPEICEKLHIFHIDDITCNINVKESYNY